MKKTILSFFFIVFCAKIFAQNGLEDIIVEKYYISNGNDTNQNSTGGILPVGSVTYRIFIDMLPDYRFQAVYGVPAHEWRMETTTLFFNNEDRGNTTPGYSKTQAAGNTVMLDSWLTVGAACNGGYFGVIKSEDDGIATVVNSDGVLLNTDPNMGIPLTTQDGIIMVPGRLPENVQTLNITTEMGVFNDQNDGTNGPVFSTTNGALSALNGAKGPDTVSNKVLVAQITTDGIFSFRLNIQIGTPSGGVEKYVADSATGSEILFPACIYNSTVGIHSVSAPSSYLNIFPNPATDHIGIKFISNNPTSGRNFYSIYDTYGRLVMKNDVEVVNERYSGNLDISSLTSGIYTVEFVSGKSVQRTKFIKN